MLIPGDKATEFVGFIVELIETVLDERMSDLGKILDKINAAVIITKDHEARINNLSKLVADLDQTQQRQGITLMQHTDNGTDHETRITQLEENATNGEQDDVIHQLAAAVVQIMNTPVQTTASTPTQQPKRDKQDGTHRVRNSPLQYQPRDQTRQQTLAMVPDKGWITATAMANQGHKKGSRPWEYWQKLHARNLLYWHRQQQLQRRHSNKPGREYEYAHPTTPTN